MKYSKNTTWVDNYHDTTPTTIAPKSSHWLIIFIIAANVYCLFRKLIRVLISEMYLSVGVCEFLLFIVRKIFEKNREESVSYVRGQRKQTLLFMCQLLTMIDSDKSVCVSRHRIYRPSRSSDKTAKNHFQYFF